MRATSKSGYGRGWHKQSVRHSLARKTGRAGGNYVVRDVLGRTPQQLTKINEARYRASTENKFPREYDDRWRNRGVRVIEKDSDGDGVPDSKDCQPHNPKAQDTYELENRYDKRKSFYGKAKVETDENTGTKTLTSYSTEVAYIKDGKAYVKGTYSATTLRHIKEFLKQNGFKAENSKQIMKDYGENRKEGTTDYEQYKSERKADETIMKANEERQLAQLKKDKRIMFHKRGDAPEEVYSMTYNGRLVKNTPIHATITKLENGNYRTSVGVPSGQHSSKEFNTLSEARQDVRLWVAQMKAQEKGLSLGSSGGYYRLSGIYKGKHTQGMYSSLSGVENELANLN